MFNWSLKLSLKPLLAQYLCRINLPNSRLHNPWNNAHRFYCTQNVDSDHSREDNLRKSHRHKLKKKIISLILFNGHHNLYIKICFQYRQFNSIICVRLYLSNTETNDLDNLFLRMLQSGSCNKLYPGLHPCIQVPLTQLHSSPKQLELQMPVQLLPYWGARHPRNIVKNDKNIKNI